MPGAIGAPTVTLDIGRDLALQADAFPGDLRREGVRLLRGMRERMPGGLRPDDPRVRRAADFLRARTRGRWDAEARAIAPAVGATRRELLLAGASYDLVMNFLACSCAVLETPEGPVLARNMDWWPEDLLARASVVVRYERRGRLRLANAGWPGAIGVVTGMSGPRPGGAFGVSLNAVFDGGAPKSGAWRTWAGYSVMLAIRRVLEDARGFRDAVERLTRARLMSPCLLAVVGSENGERVVLEKRGGVPGAERRWGTPGRALVVTNDYRRCARAPRVPTNSPGPRAGGSTASWSCARRTRRSAPTTTACSGRSGTSGSACRSRRSRSSSAPDRGASAWWCRVGFSDRGRDTLRGACAPALTDPSISGSVKEPSAGVSSSRTVRERAALVERPTIADPRVYAEVRRLAASQLRRERRGHTLQTTALAHEAVLRIKKSGGGFVDEGALLSAAARVMRQVLVDHARRRNALKRGGDRDRVCIEAAEPASDGSGDRRGGVGTWGTIDVLALEEALARLEELHERQARVVELRFFGGLSAAEIAPVLGVSTRTVESDWAFARAWLRRALSDGARGDGAAGGPGA